ncbi:hypothetical protein DSO57_1006637 [Entomophthora muscae]|uniref:Uncharacterized protein n=1 Tax=Entomophthora muscae TaxID=34485 RepID=A0ACC2U5J4_9FUNG|nr:hypothetical protein DSO57_1006637 [Entomophthora muscae]
MTSVTNGKHVTSFIQVSSLHITYKATNPNLSKVESIQTRDKETLQFSPIDLRKIYSVVTTDFIAKGGDNLLNPPHPNIIPVETLDQVVIDFITKHSPVSPKEINHIINLVKTAGSTRQQGSKQAGL